MNFIRKKKINKLAIEKTFGKAAKNYDNMAKFQQEVGQYLLNSVSSNINSKMIILDAGCGTGYFSKKLKIINNNIIALDISLNMLLIAKRKKTARIFIQGDIETLPFQDKSIDFCFSNLVIQWCNNLSKPLGELYRITKKGGLIVFSTLLDGSLIELKKCLKKLKFNQKINTFKTFEEIKSICKTWIHTLEKKTWYLTYPSFNSLLQSIKGVGATYSINNKKKGLITKNFFHNLKKIYPIHNNKFPLTYNLLFGKLYRE